MDTHSTTTSRGQFLRLTTSLAGHGEELTTTWRTHEFEYTWLRNSMHQYKDFWHVTQNALVYAMDQCNIKVDPAHSFPTAFAARTDTP